LENRNDNDNDLSLYTLIIVGMAFKLLTVRNVRVSYCTNIHTWFFSLNMGLIVCYVHNFNYYKVQPELYLYEYL